MTSSEGILGKKNFAYTGCENLEAMQEAAKYNDFLLGLVTRRIKPGKDAKVLDFGAGSGTYAKMLKDKGVTPDCLEPDKTLQTKLRDEGFKVLEGAHQLEAEAYDVIYALNVFEHIDDDFAEMEKLSKALKKGGSLVIYVPAYKLLFSSMDRQVGHIRRYRRSRLKHLVRSVDLEVKELFYYDPIGFLAALTYRLIGKDGVLTPASVRLYDKYIFSLSKALHPVSKRLIGKNAVVVAEK